MKQSKLFTKTRKTVPSDEISKNAQLLIQAGFIHKEMAGVYSYLPLGLRVLKNIEAIIREEMNTLGGQEVFMSALQDKEVWKKTNRWNDDIVDIWFKTKLKNEAELGLSFTHEEPLTRTVSNYVNSYRDLPFSVYQFQTKFRNELRAKSGIMRGREFLMKDLYSFSATVEDHDIFYEKVKQAYISIFNRCGLGDKTFVTFASGGVFSKYSHEFQTLTDAGEDVIYLSRKRGIAVNKEVYTDEVLLNLELSKDELEEVKAVEVGNIFSLGTRFSEPLGLSYKNEQGEEKPVVMGSYGIGLGRLMGTIVEALSDERGIVWPREVAPFRVHLISIKKDEEALKIYQKLSQQGIEVLLDDRDVSPGEKFADADLIGIPFRLVVSDKTLQMGKVEFKKRSEKDVLLIELEDIVHMVEN